MNAYPRVAIHFCTGCKWNLRAAWYLQELLSTFGNQLGEVALLPASSGTFVIELVTEEGAKPILLWDRKTNGGFPGEWCQYGDRMARETLVNMYHVVCCSSSWYYATTVQSSQLKCH
jgi:selT/selW/selH-like putative selenoprotein